MLAHYPQNLWESLKLSVTDTLTASALAWLGWLGMLFALGERRSKPALLLLCAGAFYLLLMGLNHWETRYYFFLMVLYAGFAAWAASRWLALARGQGWLAARAFDAVPVAIVGALFALAAAQSREIGRAHV